MYQITNIPRASKPHESCASLEAAVRLFRRFCGDVLNYGHPEPGAPISGKKIPLGFHSPPANGVQSTGGCSPSNPSAEQHLELHVRVSRVRRSSASHTPQTIRTSQTGCVRAQNQPRHHQRALCPRSLPRSLPVFAVDDSWLHFAVHGSQLTLAEKTTNAHGDTLRLPRQGDSNQSGAAPFPSGSSLFLFQNALSAADKTRGGL